MTTRKTPGIPGVFHISEILAEVLGDGSAARFLEATALPPPAAPLTWARLLALEPALGPIWARVQAEADPGGPEGVCGALRYAAYKAEVGHLIGWDRPLLHPILSTREAYAFVIREIAARMPACRGAACGCL